jgi:hypothetical protein
MTLPGDSYSACLWHAKSLSILERASARSRVVGVASATEGKGLRGITVPQSAMPSLQSGCSAG